MVLLSIATKLLPARLSPLRVLARSTTENWGCFCCPHWSGPARCFLGAMGRTGALSDKPSALMGLPILSGGESSTIALYTAELQEEGGGKHLILVKCVVGIQCFEGQIRHLELKEAIYVPCNFHFEVPQI